MKAWWNLYALKVGKVTDENGEEWVRAVFSNAAEATNATDEELAFAIEALFCILSRTNAIMANDVKAHMGKTANVRRKEMKKLFDKLSCG